MNWFFLILATAGISFFLTYVLRRYALANSMIDVPNARSSHTIPTPRGGGISIVVVFILLLLYSIFVGGETQPVAIALCGSGFVVALIGFLDDRGHVAARWRLLAHFLGAAWALFWLPAPPPLEFFGRALTMPWLLYPLAALFLVWLLNLYNFMDGIDGIASIEAITACLSGSLIFWLLGYPDQVILPLALAAAVAGFLMWNLRASLWVMREVVFLG